MNCLFFDYDGTLYVDGAVSEKNLRAIRRVRECGDLVFLNTGRSRGFVPQSVLSAIDFDGLCCGAVYCSLGDRVFFDRVMPKGEVAAILRSAEVYDVPLHLEGNEASYTYLGDREIPKNPFGLSNNIVRELGGIEAFLSSPAAEKIAKISFITNETTLPEGLCTGDLRLVQMNGFIEGIPAGYTKATPMQVICDTLSVPVANTIAFGDSLNDEDMLAFAGRSALMPHAPKELDKYAAFRASLSRDGVAEAIAYFYGWDYDSL